MLLLSPYLSRAILFSLTCICGIRFYVPRTWADFFPSLKLDFVSFERRKTQCLTNK